MNDWLDYKDSGSVRANANILEHAASIPSGRKINSIRGNVVETAAKVRDEKYDYINKELDALYTEMQAQLARQKKLAADLNSFTNVARRLKATLVLSANGNRSMNNKWASINSKIDSFSGSNLQKTALRNKLDSMTNKFNSAVPNTTGFSTDISLDTFNTMIDELNQNSKINR